jgi:hypothetical protein
VPLVYLFILLNLEGKKKKKNETTIFETILGKVTLAEVYLKIV